MAKEPVVEVEINKMVYGGDAIGRLPDGRAVFVAGVLPGERVSVRLVEDKPRFARGALLEVLTPSPDRVETPPGEEDGCAGCHYQFMTYEAQLRVKTDILIDQFQRIGGVASPPVANAVPSPRQWHYRNAAQFHLAPDGRLGFQEPGSHQVVPVKECLLCEKSINEILPLLEFEALPEGLERIEVRAGAGDDRMIIFESQSPQPPELTVDLPISVVHLFVDEQGDTHPVVMAGDDAVVMEALGRAFRVSAGSFFQVNTAQAENMVRYLLDALPAAPGAAFLEVYAGVGLFSAFFAPKVDRLVAVESGSSAVEDFTANLDEFENVEIYEGLAEEILPALDLAPDFCLVDPPRAGLALPALDALARLAPRLLAYISCDPATLARDAKRLLSAGYRLKSVQPFDMFPQTYHIESISIFIRE